MELAQDKAPGEETIGQGIRHTLPTAQAHRAAAKQFLLSAYRAGLLSPDLTERLIRWGGLRHA